MHYATALLRRFERPEISRSARPLSWRRFPHEAERFVSYKSLPFAYCVRCSGPSDLARPPAKQGNPPCGTVTATRSPSNWRSTLRWRAPFGRSASSPASPGARVSPSAENTGRLGPASLRPAGCAATCRSPRWGVGTARVQRLHPIAEPGARRGCALDALAPALPVPLPPVIKLRIITSDCFDICAEVKEIWFER